MSPPRGSSPKTGRHLLKQLAQSVKSMGGHLYVSFGKRTIDAVVSFVSLVMLFPFLAIIAILVRCTSKGPAFYKQERVGRGGRSFWIAKFRTMHVGADQNGLHITTSHDARITRLGAFLRKFK